VYALKKLELIVDYQWHEIADVIPQIESMVEDENFPERSLAAKVGSKVFYHLEEYDDALRLVLEAGDRFNINDDSQYVNTLVFRALDIYIQKRQAQIDKKEEVEIDRRLEDMINFKFEQCFTDGMFKQALGIALETRRIDMVSKSIEKSNNTSHMLSYTYSVALSQKNQEFRKELLRTILQVYEKEQDGQDHDYYKIVRCQFLLDLPKETADLLERLVVSDNDNDYLTAYQIGFDLVDNESQAYTGKIID
jgi:26S proteasome regulatory subunit N2